MNLETPELEATLQKSLKIGPLEIPNRLILAPLAGVSDVAFRRICQEHGAGLTFVEMMAANALHHHNPRTVRMLTRHPDEPVLGVQLSGPTLTSIDQGISMLNDFNFDVVDLNMGCPVRKIVGKGYGSALLKQPELVYEMVSLGASLSTAPCTVKIRLGFTRDTINVEEISTAIAEAGASMITIHGRTREDNYGVPVQYDLIAQGFESARKYNPEIACIGNGDVMDKDSAEKMMKETQADGLMVSRGALGDPWLFNHLIEKGTRHVRPAEWLETVLRHIDYHEAYHEGRATAPMLFRKHLLWYITGFHKARQVRDQLATSPSFEHMRGALKEFAASLDPASVRYQEELERRTKDFDPKYDMDRKLDR